VGYRRWRTTGLNAAKANANNLPPGTNENITFKARDKLPGDFDISRKDCIAQVY